MEASVFTIAGNNRSQYGTLMRLDFGLQIINPLGRFNRLPHVPLALLKLEMEQVDLGHIANASSSRSTSPSRRAILKERPNDSWAPS